MTNRAKYAVTLALILVAIVAVAGGFNLNSPADAVASDISAKPGGETPVRATKGDRLRVRSEIRRIEGVTLVMRDFGQTIR